MAKSERRDAIWRWVRRILVLLVLGVPALIFGQLAWTAFQSSRPCESSYRLSATGLGIVAVEPATEDWRSVLTDAAADSPACFTFEVSGSATVGQIGTVKEAAALVGARVAIRFVD
jgi:hypothetical protein